jgi:predicted molibdopterin-dependent oxidoreductase YjgC
VSGANVNDAEANLNNIEFLVVQEVFMTETAKLAHILLPAAMFSEKDGTITNSERRIQRIRAAVKPPGQARPDYEIINEIAARMGYKSKFNKDTPKKIFNEIRRSVGIYSCATWDQVDRTTVQWPCNKDSPQGTKILYEKEFAALGNHGTFYPLSFVHQNEEDENYPYYLISHRLLKYYNTGKMTEQMFKKDPKADWVEISASDARRERIKEGDKVRVSSAYGHIITRAHICRRMCKGVLAIPGHFPRVRVNRLVGPEVDKIANIPAFKDCQVKIEKVNKK